MHIHTSIYIYIYISQHVDHPNINALCLGSGTRDDYIVMQNVRKIATRVNNSNVSLLTVKIIPQRIGVWTLIVSH